MRGPRFFRRFDGRARLAALGHEGFRLFFPASALHMALWPFLWVVVAGFDLVGAGDIAPSIWHGHELIVGSFGAALLGFLTTAVPEWTDTEPLRGRALWLLAAAWGLARLAGFAGWSGGAIFAGFADLAWMLALLIYVLVLSWRRRTDQLLAFAFWLVLLLGSGFAARWGMALGDNDLAQKGVYLTGFTMLGFLGIALGRISVPVTNLVLDPSERSSPFRPHPGRLNLSAGLVGLAIMGEIFGISEPVRGYLWLAAGAGFLDRVGEAFIGRSFFRIEILALAASAALAGAGLMLFGFSLLGADFGPLAGLHLAFMGGLGVGIFAVFSIAGLIHAGHNLPFPPALKYAFLALVTAAALRVGPDLGLMDHPFEAPYVVASLFWALGAGIWAWVFWPLLSSKPEE